MDVIRGAKISMGVDPLGGAGVHYWGPIAERYGLNLTVVNEAVDPTFRFMTVDWDGQIRMDPSSPYAMQRLIGLKDRFEIAFACDTDHDRHGIVTKSAGLLPPNHYLSVAIFYLFQHRPKWRKEAAVGKTVVSSQMIDRVTAKLGRKLYEVPVGFKWFVDGLLDGSLGFGGEESAGASFVRLDGSVWTTDKDGIVPALLAAEITARMGRDPGEIYRELTREFGEPVYDRVEAPATPEQKEMLAKLSPQQVKLTELAGEKIQTILTQRAGQRRAHRRVEGGGRERMVRGASVRDRGYLQDLCGELPGSGSSAPHPGGSPDDCQRCSDAAVASPRRGEIMSKQTRVSHPIYNLLPTEIEGFDSLAELALDMRWSWNHATDEVWRQLDPELWEITHNPWVVLQTVSRDQIERVLADPAFRKNVDDLVQSQAAGGGGARVVSAESSAGSLDLRRVFQHGIHVERSAAHLLGRTWQCGRRSTQSRQRSGRAGGRRGAALPARLFSPGDRQGRSATGPLSRTTTPDSCRSRRCASRTASGCGWRSPCPVTRSGCAPGRSRSAE